MTSWTTPLIVGVNELSSASDATPLIQHWITASGVVQVLTPTADDWVLKAINGHLCLVRPDGVSQHVDFTQGKSRHRTKESAAGAPHLKKAFGLSAFKKKHGRLPSIIDATGGWGQDAWAIASLGCAVTVIEKHPVVHAVLANGLASAALDAEYADNAARITLINQDACEALKKLEADVIYLDPMYPHRHRKKANSKKGMQILQALLGPSNEEHSTNLLDAALANTASRVIVKRPKGADAIDPTALFVGQKFVIESPNTRYDVYQQPGPQG